MAEERRVVGNEGEAERRERERERERESLKLTLHVSLPRAAVVRKRSP